MPNINRYVFDTVAEKFKNLSIDGAEWQYMMPMLAELQAKGLNEAGPHNPFATPQALEKLQYALLNTSLRKVFFPDITYLKTQRFLATLTCEGPPSLGEIYSLSACYLLDLAYKQGSYSLAEIMAAAANRLDVSDQVSQHDVFNALTSMHASKVLHRYSWDVPCGRLTSSIANQVFDRYIVYQKEQKNLAIVRSVLQENPDPKMPATDQQSLFKRIKCRECFLQSEKIFKCLYPKIQATNCERDLTIMLEQLKSALRSDVTADNPYQNLHPVINQDLQHDIHKRIAEGFQDYDYYGQRIIDEAEAVTDTDSALETELESSSQWFDLAISPEWIFSPYTQARQSQQVSLEPSSPVVSECSTADNVSISTQDPHHSWSPVSVANSHATQGCIKSHLVQMKPQDPEREHSPSPAHK